MPPDQPETPVKMNEPAAAEPELPVAELVQPQRPRRDPAAVAREANRLKRLVRFSLIATAIILTGVFVAAFRINPYDADGTPRTMSTHTQLGMPPCTFVFLAGKPCPSCGMTTSFALLVRGDIAASMRANWVGSLLCVFWAATLIWAVAGTFAGKMLWVPPGRGEMYLTMMVGGILTLMLARWAVVLLS